MSLAGVWKQLRWSSDCGQGPDHCSRRTDQRWQKPGGRTCWVGDVVSAVDFAQRNEVSGQTVGRSERRDTEVPHIREARLLLQEWWQRTACIPSRYISGLHSAWLSSVGQLN